MSIRHHFGRFLEHAGYRITASYRYPVATLDILELGCLAVTRLVPPPAQVVQIGAFDGQLCDPLQSLLAANQGIAALLVEPQKMAFDSLSRLYGHRPEVRLENAAIGEADGVSRLYLPADQEQSPLASLDVNHLDRFGIRRSARREIEVPALTVRSLFAKHSIRHVDILQIDTEGSDLRILQGVFDLRVTPLVVNLESRHLCRDDRKQLREELERRGYRYADTEQDTFAVQMDELLRLWTGGKRIRTCDRSL